MHLRAPLDSVQARFAAVLQLALARKLAAADVIQLGDTLTAAGQDNWARELYRVWLDQPQDDPLLIAIQYNYGNLLFRAHAVADARAAFQAALDLRPDFVPARLLLGSVCENLGDRGQAAAQWAEVVNQLAPVQGEAVKHKVIALKQIGRLADQAKQYEMAEDALRQCLDLDPHQLDVAENWMGLRQIQCKWPTVAPSGNVTRAALADAVTPLLLSRGADTPMHLLAVAHAIHRRESVARREIPTVGTWPAPPTLRRPKRLRIGYLCSDLRAHALGSLLVGIFGLHDRARFEVFAYYTGPDAQDPIRARIEASVDGWRSIGEAKDKEAAALIVADGVDILVDLNGHTKGARRDVLALRPAPIIVNWLGYPGTMGTPYHHYIIADSTTIPPGSEKYYSETVRRLPCYQPNDRQRAVAGGTPSRAELSLPEAAMVYCCFNTQVKITEAQFSRWLAILAGVPDSVLWLLAGGDAVNARLRDIACQAGIAPERLIFAGFLPNAAHLARYRVADLFLDTFPYGAHTTASDALWMGLPVVTLMGRSFASRVCGSLVRSAGLPALACETPEAFVQTAIRLGRDPAARLSCRQTLATARETCALFDTAGLVRALEGRFDGMWTDYATGALPVPDLTNLPTYAEIGREDVLEPAECWSHSSYDERYRRAMAYRHALSPLPADGRLWHGSLS
jgi:predicted O-linked N-acetylglucosamine transferase (SPINDLY family)